MNPWTLEYSYRLQLFSVSSEWWRGNLCALLKMWWILKVLRRKLIIFYPLKESTFLRDLSCEEGNILGNLAIVWFLSCTEQCIPSPLRGHLPIRFNLYYWFFGDFMFQAYFRSDLRLKFSEWLVLWDTLVPLVNPGLNN